LAALTVLDIPATLDVLAALDVFTALDIFTALGVLPTYDAVRSLRLVRWATGQTQPKARHGQDPVQYRHRSLLLVIV